DERVERTDGGSTSFEKSAQITVAIAGGFVERHDGNFAEQHPKVEFRAPRLFAFGDSEMELGQRNGTHAELGWRHRDQVAAYAVVSVDHGDANVGVEHHLHMGRRFSARLVFHRRIGGSTGTKRSQKSPQSSPSGSGVRTSI